LGTVHKEQYDVLGPVVNQTSRVEGIAKKVGVNILATSVVAERVPANRVLTRRVAKFRPAGMQNEIDLYTIDRAPQSAEERKQIEERFGQHARGLAAFESGDWEEAFKVLHPIVETDPAALYIYSLTLEHKRKAPAGWRGVVEMADK
ncbi:MAG: hypothetical protein HOP29_20080, partial [Phycisphaerales bacterium]|nr:hypothetical protein [Phycisphaerales bacterium]